MHPLSQSVYALNAVFEGSLLKDASRTKNFQIRMYVLIVLHEFQIITTG